VCKIPSLQHGSLTAARKLAEPPRNEDFKLSGLGYYTLRALI
jgi:hypothetical protein